jgi:hypothetical protein
MSYDTIYHFCRFNIINTYWASTKESGVGELKIEELESEVLCTNSTALALMAYISNWYGNQSN